VPSGEATEETHQQPSLAAVESHGQFSGHCVRQQISSLRGMWLAVSPSKEKKTMSTTAWIVVLLLVFLLIGGGGYFYRR